MKKVTTAYQLKQIDKHCADQEWDSTVHYVDRNVSATAKHTATGKRRAVRPAFDHPRQTRRCLMPLTLVSSSDIPALSAGYSAQRWRGLTRPD
jgi:hypothetical protein